MPFLQSLLRTKAITSDPGDHSMNKCLTAFDLTLLGIGAIIGAGIFVLTGVAAATKAGPAIMISFIIAGFTSGLAAMAYAELASAIGGCGSAYGYAYAGLGEIFAWIIGWELILEYGVGAAAVAIGWSGYFDNVLHAMGVKIPNILLSSPLDGGIINLPAVLLILLITILIAIGVKDSSRVNNFMVFIKLTAIAVFIAVASEHFNINNWHPFLPFGFHGIINGAAIVFFAYIGFDAVSTAAEETINPQKNLPIGIILSLIICTIIYIIVSGLLTGITHYTTLNNASPVSHTLLQFGLHSAAAITSAGAIAGLTTVVLVLMYGLTRILLAITRDKLLPNYFAKINIKTKTPVRGILLCGVIIALLSGFINIEVIASVVNIGTLSAFLMVSLGVIVLRKRQPDLHRPFKMPLSPYLPVLSVILCFYLMMSLSRFTWVVFSLWTIIGLIIYFCYGRKRSELN